MAEQESLYLWATTALTNGSSDPAINFAENQLPSTVNNSNRAQMAAIARYIKDTDGSLTTAGSANAYTLTINGRQTPLATGHILTFKASFTNTAPVTLAVTNADAVALGAKAIRAPGDAALLAGNMISGGVYQVRYDTAANSAAGAWILLNPTPVIRETLTADRTYYVLTTGSDSNNGLTNVAGGAFLTIQKAIDTILKTIDRAGFVCTVQVGAGTYTGANIVSGPSVGGAVFGTNYAPIVFQGDTVTPANVIISTTSADCFKAIDGATIRVRGFRLKTTTSGYALRSEANSKIYFDLVDFNVCVDGHRFALSGANISALGNYSITGGAASHGHAHDRSYLEVANAVVTITGTPAFSLYYEGNAHSFTFYTSVTFAGSATGPRYFVHENGVINTNGGSETYFPGNAIGTVGSGGIYVINDDGSWIAWTPTIATVSGTAGTAAGRYMIKEKTMFFAVTLTISAAGSAVTMTIPLPTGSSKSNCAFGAIDISIGLANTLVAAYMSATNNAISVSPAGGAFTTHSYAVSGSFEMT